MKINYLVEKHSHSIEILKKIEDRIHSDLTRLSSDKKVLFVVDKNISKKKILNIFDQLKMTGCKVYILRLVGDKKNKGIKTLLRIIDFLIDKKFTKKSVMISAGGGVIGDIAGLAASLYLRGMIYLHIPTTITAIVDSCIGGKTAINYKNIINSLGNYYHPTKVYIDFEIINEMPEREFISGIPEIMKCGLIKKNSIIEILLNSSKKIKSRDFGVIKKLIQESLNTKIHYFKDDVHENNVRLFLNFGHTFAHAIEMATFEIEKKDFYRHGEAVGIGILCELLYANKSKRGKVYNTVKNILKLYGLPTNIKKFAKVKNLNSLIFEKIYLDKKKLGKYPRYISLKNIGTPKTDFLKNSNLINSVIFEIAKEQF